MAPPSLPLLTAPSSRMCARVNVTPLLTTNRRVLDPPVRVITSPPSSVVSWLMVLALVRVIVLGPPQLKVMAPPPARAVSRSLSVQLPPTTPSAAGAARAGLGSVIPTSSTAKRICRERRMSHRPDVDRRQSAEGRRQEARSRSHAKRSGWVHQGPMPLAPLISFAPLWGSASLKRRGSKAVVAQIAGLALPWRGAPRPAGRQRPIESAVCLLLALHASCFQRPAFCLLPPAFRRLPSDSLGTL